MPNQIPYDLHWSKAALAQAGTGLGPVRERLIAEVEDIISQTEGNAFATSVVTEGGAVFFCQAERHAGRWRVECRRGRMRDGPLMPDTAPPALRGKRLMIPALDESGEADVDDAQAVRGAFL